MLLRESLCRYTESRGKAGNQSILNNFITQTILYEINRKLQLHLGKNVCLLQQKSDSLKYFERFLSFKYLRGTHLCWSCCRILENLRLPESFQKYFQPRLKVFFFPISLSFSNHVQKCDRTEIISTTHRADLFGTVCSLSHRQLESIWTPGKRLPKHQQPYTAQTAVSFFHMEERKFQKEAQEHICF